MRRFGYRLWLVRIVLIIAFLLVFSLIFHALISRFVYVTERFDFEGFPNVYARCGKTEFWDISMTASLGLALNGEINRESDFELYREIMKTHFIECNCDSNSRGRVYDLIYSLKSAQYSKTEKYPTDSEACEFVFYTNGFQTNRVIYAYDFIQQELFCIYKKDIFIVSDFDVLRQEISEYFEISDTEMFYTDLSYYENTSECEYDCGGTDGAFRYERFFVSDFHHQYKSGRDMLKQAGKVNLDSTIPLNYDREKLVELANEELGFVQIEYSNVYYDSINKYYRVVICTADEDKFENCDYILGSDVILDEFGNTICVIP